MSLAIGLTLWLSFGAFLFFGTMNAPAVFARLAIGLCFSELVAAIAWSLVRQDCVDHPCPQTLDTLASAAGLQIPALTAAMFLLAGGYGLHMARRW